MAGNADTIQLPDRKFNGEITKGFPDSISIEIQNATATITRDKILSIDFGDPTTIASTTGHTFKGELTSSPSEIITIETDAGAVEVPLANIQSLSFPREEVPVPQFCQIISLNDNEQHNGNIKEGMTDPLQIEDQSGATARLELNKIRDIRYGTPNVVRTQKDNVYRGEIVSQIPHTLVLRTAYGSLEINQDAITRIHFLDPEECQDGQNGPIDFNPLFYLAIGGFLLAALLFILR